MMFPRGFGLKVGNCCWIQSVPPAVAGGCAALKQFGARLRTHPLPRAVLTVSKFDLHIFAVFAPLREHVLPEEVNVRILLDHLSSDLELNQRNDRSQIRAW